MERIERKRFDEAIEIYNKIVKINPFDEDALTKIGWSYLKLKNYELGIKYAKEALSLRPDYSGGYNTLAAIYRMTGENDLAIVNLKKAIDLVDDSKGKVILLTNLSVTYLRDDQFSEASISINKALEIDSTHTHSWWIKGEIFTQQEKLDSSFICLTKAVNLKPLHDYLQEQLYHDYALCLLDLSKVKLDKKEEYLKMSQDYILKAMDLDPENKEYKTLLNEIKAMR
jgi:tetratricopeptide (TPR) repeat protein